MRNTWIRSLAMAFMVCVVLVSDEVLSSCYPKCDSSHCCVFGKCEKRRDLGEQCSPNDIHSNRACPCRIGFVCTEENNEFRCKNHLQTGAAAASAVVHTTATEGTTPTTAPSSTTAVSPTTTTPTPITTTTTTPRPITTTTTTPKPITTTTTTPSTTTTTPQPITITTPPTISTNALYSTPFSTAPFLKDSPTPTPHFRYPGSPSDTPESYSPTGNEPWGTPDHPASRKPHRPTRPHRPFNSRNRPNTGYTE